MWKSILHFSVVLATCLLSQRDAIAGMITTSSDHQAQAYSVLPSFDLEFSLTGDQSVEALPPVVFDSPLVSGNAGGDFSEAGVQGNFPLGEVFGPNPPRPAPKFRISIFGGVNVFADPPPGSFALFIQEVTGFFTFRNYAEQAATISLSYHGTYSLLAQGDTSNARIDLEAQTTPLGGEPSDTALISDFITNDNRRDDVLVPTEGEGTLSIDLAAATIIDGVVIPGKTDLRLELTNTAEAEAVAVSSVPEPSTFTLLGLGSLGMLVYARRRKQSAA